MDTESNGISGLVHYQWIFRAAVIGLFCLGLGALALGQADLATLRVRIIDNSGAVIPGAQVTVREVSKNVSFSAVSGDTGLATFATLRPGTYSVSVEMSGFNHLQINGVELSVSERRLLEAALEVATVSETVEVTADEPIQTEEGTLATGFDKQSLTDLPLQARRYTDLVLLAPGVNVSASNGLLTRGFGWFVVNGNYGTQNNFLLDGFDNNQGTTNIQARSAQVVQPSPDSLAELKVMTNSYSAEFGRGAGAVVNTTLKSGTNEYHGSVWWYNRDDALAANSWGANLVGASKVPLRWNQPGGTFGGPIVKDRVFFFGDYEGFFRETGTTSTFTVPTPEMKRGIFPFTVKDPLTGQPFAGNTIPEDRWDTLGGKIGALYPDPNTPGIVSRGRNLLNYVKQLIEDEDTNKFDIRIDFFANEKHNIFGRYSFLQQDIFGSPIFDGLADGQGETGAQFNRNQNVGLAWAWTLNPASVNEFRFGYTRQNAYFRHATVNDITALEFGFRGDPFERAQDFGGLPKIDMSNYQDLGTRNYRPQSQKPTQYQFLDTWSYVKGNHLIKAGFEYRYKNNEFIDISRRNPDFRFRGRITGDDFADLLLGLADRIRVSTVPVVEQRQDAYAWFLQDDIKVNPRFTLNLGLRYGYTTPYYAKGPVYNKNFDFQRGTLVVAPGVDPGGIGVVGDDKYLTDRDFNDLAPRIGGAFQIVPGKIVLRGGYGIFYAPEEFIGSEGNLPLNPPTLLGRSISGTFQLSDPLSDALLDPAVFDTTTLNLRARNKDYRTPMVHQYNLTLQFMLPWESSAQIAYVGNRGTNLFGIDSGNQVAFGLNGAIPANRPYPQWGEIQLITTSTKSWYDSLQFSFRHRFSYGFSFNADYTYASALFTGGAFTQAFEPPQIAGQFQRQRNGEYSRHRTTIYGIFQLPIGRDRALGSNMNRALDAIVGGWQISGNATLRSGQAVYWFMNPTGVTPEGQPYAYFDRNDGGFLFPNCVGDPNEGSDTKDRLHYLNVSAFQFPGVNKPGNCNPGAILGPGLALFDMGISKSFTFDEHKQLQIRVDAFNAFNHTNYGNPFPLYGFPGLFGAILGARAPRDIQIGVRFTF